MTYEKIFNAILNSINKDETLQEFLSGNDFTGEEEELLITSSTHPDILKRVFMFDRLAKLPFWLLTELNYNLLEEGENIEENLKIKMSVLFKF